ncbi:hypothetical protein ANCDUO_06883 [Ancylostoma duodenale]|uniref:Uncharacterized protein n=1 Tax=Ancylostoma duodenale TaxID=51022 RepID=A0A0C2GNG8_9BILA|nr:hypothetical protein ANCDUO_06883 [Ancylostoma duodenale]
MPLKKAYVLCAHPHPSMEHPNETWRKMRDSLFMYSLHHRKVRISAFNEGIIYAFLAITVALVVIPIFQEFSVTALAIGICLIGFVMYFIFVHPNVLPTWMYILNGEPRPGFDDLSSKVISVSAERTTFVCSVVFDCLPDLKPGVGSAFLPTSDSSQALLPKRCSSARLSEEDSLPDLHSDEKNVFRRNGSTTGFKLL